MVFRHCQFDPSLLYRMRVSVYHRTSDAVEPPDFSYNTITSPPNYLSRFEHLLGLQGCSVVHAHYYIQTAPAGRLRYNHPSLNLPPRPKCDSTRARYKLCAYLGSLLEDLRLDGTTPSSSSSPGSQARWPPLSRQNPRHPTKRR